MIRLPGCDALTGAERHGLALLIDLARLPPVEDERADVVRLELTTRDPRAVDLPTCLAHDWYLERGDGVVRVPRAVLRCITAVAGAAAEQHTRARDRHGRVPATANALVQVGRDAEPVVSRAAVRLREAVLGSADRRPVALAAPWPHGRRWAAAFTHDLDIVAYWPLFTLLRLAELAKKAELARWGRTAVAALGALGRDPVGRGVRAVLEVEHHYAVTSTWFVLCGTPTLASLRAGDVTYRPESRAVAAIVSALVARGCEIGLHGSFATTEHPALWGEQRARLERLSGQPVRGVRQHFLRMRPGATQHGMRAAGFQYDATYGFPDRNGFRLGVADVIPAWDALAERPLELEEVPLCWMDRSLSKYRGVEEPEAWVSEGLALARACREVEGVWVGVWHPNLIPPLGFPDAPAAFARLVERIVADAPFLGTLSSLVAWRTARRGLRIQRVAPDGRVEAHTPELAAAPLALEDPAGRPVAVEWARV
ncbi:MAG TPA: hypothetical protein VEU55_03170 [Gemmatimonadales bacterium]|nr:hypothetical protein [Gemmatimonadales bacterium]